MMGRRRLVVLVSALLMIALGAAVVGGLVAATQGARGRDWIRRVVQVQLDRAVNGTVHLGTMSGSFITDLRLDSLEIRELSGDLFLATGPIALTFDPRDILDGRFFVRSAVIERPRARLRRDAAGVWGHQRLFASANGEVARPRSRASFGSVLVIEHVQVVDGDIEVTLPLARPDTLGRKTFTYKWHRLAAEAPRVRLAYPDSNGVVIDLAHVNVDEDTPPFDFRSARGQLRFLGESLFISLPHFELPGSVGRAEGKVWWGGNLPTRYRIHVESDSVALADVAWINGSLPTEGGGRMWLDIRNARDIPTALEYAISKMDVRAHDSRIRGRMTWVVGGPAVLLRDVDLEGVPLDFKLIERFTQAPLPYPFAGQIAGRLRASGGPLDRFVIEDVTMRWMDGNVPGAETRGRGQGVLDILDPANTIFRAFDLALGQLDLRTLQFLNPDFPKLNGFIAGTARLDSSWMDLRFSNADIVHRDGEGTESRLRGSGRLTTGEVMSYELDAQAAPLAFTTLAQSFTSIPLRGDWTGPLKVRGTISDLALETNLEGDAGRIEATLRLDSEAPAYRITGNARTVALDPRTALDDARAPSGELTARFTMNVSGDSLADLQGTAEIALDRSSLDGVRIFAGDARLRFSDGVAFLDTVQVEATALALSGAGALGLHAGRRDSVLFQVRLDSLGGLRRWLAEAPEDSLAGQATLTGTAIGWVRDFGLYAQLEGSGLLTGAARIGRLTGSADLSRLPTKPTGTLTLAADTLLASGFSIRRAFGRATMDGEGNTRFGLQMTGESGADARATATFARHGERLDVLLDSATLTTELQRWTLATPSAISNGPDGFSVDSFVLVGSTGSSLRFAGAAPSSDPMTLTVAARQVPVEDLAELLQVSGRQRGLVDADVAISGTRAAPQLEARASLNNGLVAGLRLDSLRATARTESDALAFTAALGGVLAPSLRAEGTIPFRLGFDAAGSGMRDEGPVRVTISGDSISLGVFDAITRRANGNAGTFALNLGVGGTWRRPRLDGAMQVANGNVQFETLGNARFRSLTADIVFVGDSIDIRRLSATTSSGGRDGHASASGWIAVTDLKDPHFDVSVRANAFNIYNVPNVADVDISDSIRVSGSLRNPTLRGSLTADRAIISIPELAAKDVIALEERDGFGIVDTTKFLADGYRPRQSTEFEQNLTVRNVPIRMGRDVWIRSEEANINLGGAISITKGQLLRGGADGESQLALTGSLQTLRGTYRLNLGPVQRTFEVEAGAVRFFGDPDPLSAGLDINALHTVRQYSKQGSQPDVRVRVHLGGTLLQPTAALSTPDSSRVKNADLISYLVTGGPSFEIAGQETGYYTNTALTVVLSSFGSVLGGKLAGGVCDDAQVSTSGAALEGKIGEFSNSVLSGTRLNCAKQVGEKTFVRLDAGLCQVGQLFTQESADPRAFAEAIGIKLDYILRPGLTLSGGVEPPTSAVLCSQNVSARGFVPTPQQFGVDLFRAWRF